LPFEDKLLLVGSKFVKGNFKRDFVFVAGFFEVLLAFLKAGGLPGFDGAAGQCEVAIRECEGLVDFNNPSETAASGAGSERMIEGK
jgi:hypothetical protein